MADRSRSLERSAPPARTPREGDGTATGESPDVAAERALARAVSWGLPLVTVALAIAAGAYASLGSAILVLASGVLLGAIALLWASLRTLSGDVPLLDGPAGDALRESTSELEERKRRVLLALKDIESEHQLGKLDDADYQALLARYRDDAKNVLREIDRHAAPSRVEAERLANEFLARHGIARPGGDGGGAPADTGGGGENGAAGARPAADPAAPHAAPPAARIECASCHGSNEPDAAFCKHCGAPMKGAAHTAKGANHAKA